ncbi:MAG TPA: dienelactone hydrolase family protein [Polyangiaceae bacterium]|nr:dienelactone hydrolase family protein [Polyangiaceae bacterium]
MREETIGGLKVRLTGGSDREGGGDGPMLVLMHGFGAPGTDLVPLWRQLAVPRETRFAFPEAPSELDAQAPGMDSRAWWMIDMERLERALRTGEIRDLSKEVPEGLAEANARVSAMLDELEQRFDAPSSQIILGGFSQGAMLACDVLLKSERRFAGLAILSGSLTAEPEWLPLLSKVRGLPILISHGKSDPILPFALAERLRDLLIEAGADVQFVPFNGGHGIADGVIDALSKLVTRTAQGAT